MYRKIKFKSRFKYRKIMFNYRLNYKVKFSFIG